MIITKRNKTKLEDRYNELGTAMSDGRLTEPSYGKVYHLREAILKSRRLGRPLTKEEFDEFRVDENEEKI